MSGTGFTQAWPRPGTLAGRYPERHGQARRTARRGPAPARRADLARRVDAEAAGLAEADDATLEQALRGVRLLLRGENTRPRDNLRAFALIREFAHRRLGQRPFDSQLAGGWAMLAGHVAEMDTGEGKTLTATLPACTAALAGVPVHIVTSNDYLAERDAESMRPLYAALGLSVAHIAEGMSPATRRSAYAADITYCSSKQLVFDYLRDRLARGRTRTRLRERMAPLYGSQSEGTVMRGLFFAIVDEADSVLVDEAGTPAVLARERHDDNRDTLLSEALALADGLRPGVDFSLHTRQRLVLLTDAGRARLRAATVTHGGAWASPRAREELVGQALAARHLFIRDRDYLVRDDSVQIIDSANGRVLADRSWQRGLQQLIELKEGLAPSPARETQLRISFQGLFRRYLRLAGMTGTAREVSAELGRVYGLRVSRIAPRQPPRRRFVGEQLFARDEQKSRYLVARVLELRRAGRAVLIGTRTLAASEHLSACLAEAGVPHQLLNARQDAAEAGIVARAGEPGCVTVATAMAGRGTDISLGAGVAPLGGLHVIVAERHESRRVDRQLAGRTARQGDPGSFEYITSLEDDLPSEQLPAPLTRLLTRLWPERSMPGWLAAATGTAMQTLCERRTAAARRRLLTAEKSLGKALAFVDGEI